MKTLNSLISLVYTAFLLLSYSKYLNLKVNFEYGGISVVRGGFMFVNFIGHPYPRIYVFSNLYILIKMSNHRFLQFKTVFRLTGNMTVKHVLTTIFSYQVVKSTSNGKNIGII